MWYIIFFAQTFSAEDYPKQQQLMRKASVFDQSYMARNRLSEVCVAQNTAT